MSLAAISRENIISHNTMSDWNKISGEQGSIVRWKEQASSTEEAEKTVYVGPEVEGVYENLREGVGENNSKMYMIRTAKHGLLSIWSTVMLADLMSKVAVGSEVKIVWTGSRKPKSGVGKPYHVFEVYSRPAPMQKVGSTSEVNMEEGDLPPM